MNRNDSQSNAKPVHQSRKYNPVFNRRNERVRGLWERNGIYYAQVKVRGWTGNVPLHAKTVADAQAARQVLKTEIKAGTWKTPPEREREVAKKVSTEVSTERVLRTAIKCYQVERDTLGKKDPKTRKREDTGLKRWLEFKPALPIAPERFDPKLLNSACCLSAVPVKPKP